MEEEAIAIHNNTLAQLNEEEEYRHTCMCDAARDLSIINEKREADAQAAYLQWLIEKEELAEAEKAKAEKRVAEDEETKSSDLVDNTIKGAQVVDEDPMPVQKASGCKCTIM